MDKKVEVRHKKNKKGSKAQKSKKIVLNAGSKDILCGLLVLWPSGCIFER